MQHWETQEDAVVSFDDEPLILVDADDNVVGHAAKDACHVGDGLLHRAFSIFVFDSRGRVLLQRRSDIKPLWPGYWSNSCCSHPRRGESNSQGADRRVREELGIDPPLLFLYQFSYHARYRDAGSEREMCAIYAAVCDRPVAVNAHEIAATGWVDAAVLDTELADNGDAYSPWLKLEWPRLRAQHWPQIQSLIAGHQ